MVNCKFTGCTVKTACYGDAVTKIAEYCKGHAPKEYVDVKSKTCIHPDCTTRPNYGKAGTKLAEYCKSHAPKEYVDVKHMTCIHPDCTSQPIYGKSSTKLAEYCKSHAPKDYVDVRNITCIHTDCTTRPTYGKSGSKLAEYCKSHAPKDYVNVRDKTCIHPDCTTIPTYGKLGSKLAEYCKSHAPKEYVDIRNKICIHTDCTTRPTYGKSGTKLAEYCKSHAPKEYVDIRNKICINPDCTTRPTYGKSGTKLEEYCKSHAPKDYIDVKSKTCIHPNCTTRPHYGKAGTKLAEYCKSHAPKDYVNIVSKTCIHPDCTTIPNYGKTGTKLAEYCKSHAPKDYVDIRNKTCIHPDCTTQPRYNYIGYSPEYCATHKKQGMILNPIKRCHCKKIATEICAKEFFCETHKPSDSVAITNCCSICVNPIKIDQNICDSCLLTMKDGKTVKRKLKELSVKQYLENNKVDIDSYDRIITGGCSKKRPDFIIEHDGCTIVLEVDEFQHQRTSYECECEIARMKEIYFDLGIENGKILFIRYNPDSYKPSYGKEFTTQQRLDYLIKYISELEPKDLPIGFKVVYLFYDGFTQLSEESDTINPYDTISEKPTIKKPMIKITKKLSEEPTISK